MVRYILKKDWILLWPIVTAVSVLQGLLAFACLSRDGQRPRASHNDRGCNRPSGRSSARRAVQSRQRRACRRPTRLFVHAVPDRRTYALAARDGDQRMPGVGWCATKVEDSGTRVQFHCLQPGERPSCLTVVLEHTPTRQRNPEVSLCVPDYTPYPGHTSPDAVSRFSGRLPFYDPSGLTRYPVGGPQLADARARDRLSADRPLRQARCDPSRTPSRLGANAGKHNCVAVSERVRHRRRDVTACQISARLSGERLQLAAQTLEERQRIRRRPAPYGAPRHHLRRRPKSPARPPTSRHRASLG